MGQGQKRNSMIQLISSIVISKLKNVGKLFTPNALTYWNGLIRTSGLNKQSIISLLVSAGHLTCGSESPVAVV